MTCNSCGFYAGTISPDKLPLPCPQCGSDLLLEQTAPAPPEAVRTATSDESSFNAQPEARSDEVSGAPGDPAVDAEWAAMYAGTVSTRQAHDLTSPPPTSPATSSPLSSTGGGRIYNLDFSGTAGEFFRIWIVNVFLTVVTLGIYAAWAKVRTRRYFYSNTRLAGHSFDYVAKPGPLLVGNLIVAGGFGAYYLAQTFAENLSYVVLIAFFLLFPYLVYKSLRFRAHNSVYRNLRFHFHGDLGSAYTAYLWLYLLMPLTLGIIFPFIMAQQKAYFFNNFAFGRTGSVYEGRAGKFYGIYIKAGLLGAAIYGIFFALLFGMTRGDSVFGLGAGVIFGYVLLIVGGAAVGQYVYARTTNYCWNESRLGEVRFESTLQARDLVWIQVTNLLAMIFSLGLLIPWARVRHARYVLDHITVTGDLDKFTADVAPEESALGEAAADFFDFEIGL